MVGWENCTFPRVNTSTFEEIILPTLTTVDYDNIITKLHSNIGNHTPLAVDNTQGYRASFGTSLYSQNVSSQRAELVAAGWVITDGGPI